MSTAHAFQRDLAEVPDVPETLPPLRRRVVPVHEPRPAVRVSTAAVTWPPPTQGTLALALPGRADRQPKTSRRRPPVAQPGSVMGLLPEPRLWASTFVQAAMEVAEGLRSPGQLVRWTTPEVHQLLVRRGGLTARARRAGGESSAKPRLRTIRLDSPRAGVCEVAAVIADTNRVRCVAFRMESVHGRWRVTDIEIG
jgi:hypothetical protein